MQKHARGKVTRFVDSIFPFHQCVRRSVILKPLDHDNLEKGDIELLEKTLQNINNQLDSMKYGVEISFDDFLKEINVTEEQYIKAIQYSLKRDTLLLKRSPAQIRIKQLQCERSECLESQYGYAVCVGSICLCSLHPVLHYKRPTRNEQAS